MIKVVSQTQRIVIDSSERSVAITNTGPQGPAGVPGPSEASLVLNTDGQLLTRASGELAPISRTDLAAALVSEAAFLAKAGYRNGFVNGALNVWQRGPGGFAIGTAAPYTADNVQCARNGLVTGMAVGRDVDVPAGEGLRYSLIAQRNAGDTSTQPLYIWLPLDSADSIRYQGKIVTFSVFVKAGANFSANLSKLGVELRCGLGIDQNGLTSGFSGLTSPVNTLQTITNSYARYSFTAAIPSNCTQIGVLLSWTPTGVAGTYDLVKVTGFQIEEGNAATRFEHRPYKTDLDLCLGRFERIQSPTAAYNIIGTGICYSATQAAVVIPYTKKLSKPTISVPSPGNFVVVNSVGSTITCTGLSPNYSTLEMCELGVTVSSGLSAGNATKLHANNTTSAYIDISSEL